MSSAQALSNLIVQAGFRDISLAIVLLAILQFLISLWLKSRLEASIKYSYERKMAEFQYELKIREHGTIIADFFSEWAKGAAADMTKLRRLSMELSLLLPSELYKDFGKCTTYQPNGPNSNKLLIEIRKYILKDSAGDLKDTDIIGF